MSGGREWREVRGGGSREKWRRSQEDELQPARWFSPTQITVINLTAPLKTATNKTDAAKTTRWNSCRDESRKSWTEQSRMKVRRFLCRCQRLSSNVNEAAARERRALTDNHCIPAALSQQKRRPVIYSERTRKERVRPPKLPPVLQGMVVVCYLWRDVFSDLVTE